MFKIKERWKRKHYKKRSKPFGRSYASQVFRAHSIQQTSPPTHKRILKSSKSIWRMFELLRDNSAMLLPYNGPFVLLAKVATIHHAPKGFQTFSNEKNYTGR
jgi:hypothetical protein